MNRWGPEHIAGAAGALLLGAPLPTAGPERVTIDSRQAGPGVLFVGLKGARQDGGAFAKDAVAAGAWGVLVAPEHGAEAVEAVERQGGQPGVVLVGEQPLAALQRLATAWRRELGAKVIAVTGSTGKTTTKDILVSVLSRSRRVASTRANFNTEIGVPLEILAAPAGTEVLVLEHAMRGAGQISELAAVSEPDVGVIVNVGPVHLELLGTIEAVAAAKAELIAGLREGGTAVVPAHEPLLKRYLTAAPHVITFGPGGDVQLRIPPGGDSRRRVEIDLAGRMVELEVPFAQAHLRTNLLAAVAAASAVGVVPSGRVEVAFSPGRGQRTELPGGVTVIDDCYNANPMSVRAALDDLVATAPPGGARRRVAVLGDMLELGSGEREFHMEAGRHAAEVGVDVLVTVGPLAAAMAQGFRGDSHGVATAAEAAPLVGELVKPGDVVLVKGSRGVGLELVCSSLTAGRY
ncbi:MAG: UDP-N-acetylmuramoyl-tripeptide--D-alanyl-D-alanine ligase [Solirubrobacterales bacterium]|nr:UDP-N-acetylmuramoyl-tripeptide--D-alanyl-D-alanine ligase [Solirubrobacterales bacterium]